MFKKEIFGKTNINPLKRRGNILVFLFLVIIIILLLIFSKIRIEVENFKFMSYLPKHVNKDYIIIFKLCIFKKIPIIKIKILDEKIRKLKLKEKLQKLDIRKIEKDISVKKIKKVLKENKFIIKKLNLKLEIGTENAYSTAFIIPILSTLIAFILKSRANDFKNQKFNIKPLFLNKNMVNLQFSGIFEIKMIHIINIIYILNKKERKGEDKNERTSNRRSYAYSYE